ncbi:MAG: hypothetical protein NZO16_01795, partial [Deltaproteobacteria bacterium]|nr:hypothetical protein [Deltaproteobacteria bacterium]
MSKFIYQLVIENLPTDAQSLSKLKSFLLLELEFSVEEAAEILNSIPVAVAQSDSEEKLEQIMLSLKQINVISSIKKTLTETCE